MKLIKGGITDELCVVVFEPEDSRKKALCPLVEINLERDTLTILNECGIFHSDLECCFSRYQRCPFFGGFEDQPRPALFIPRERPAPRLEYLSIGIKCYADTFPENIIEGIIRLILKYR